MREYHFELVPDDYRSWLHFQMQRGGQQKKKIIAFVLYAVLLAIMIWQRLNPKNGAVTDPKNTLVSLGLAVAVGLVLFFGMSEKHQEKLIFRKSGIERASKEGTLPKITLRIDDECIRASQEGQPQEQLISYRDIQSFEEFERIVLLCSGKTYQVIPKSAFPDEDSLTDFREFIEAKIADVKENPDRYKTLAELKEEEREAQAAEKAASAGADGAEKADDASAPAADEDGEIGVDEAAITRVNTSGMGKLGKIAHMVAADAGDEDHPAAEDTPEATSLAGEDAPQKSAPESEDTPEANSPESGEDEHGED
jgi:hypothetical protein